MTLGMCPLSIFCSCGTPPREVPRVCSVPRRVSDSTCRIVEYCTRMRCSILVSVLMLHVKHKNYDTHAQLYQHLTFKQASLPSSCGVAHLSGLLRRGLFSRRRQPALLFLNRKGQGSTVWGTCQLSENSELLGHVSTCACLSTLGGRQAALTIEGTGHNFSGADLP